MFQIAIKRSWLVDYRPRTVNDVINGAYNKTGIRACDNRDTFVHNETANVFLYHINTNARGYWIFRNFFDCFNVNGDIGYARANDLEANPGLVQVGWEQNENGTWNTNNAIDVDCVGK